MSLYYLPYTWNCHTSVRVALGSSPLREVEQWWYYCSGVLQYASGHLTPNELLHVHPGREGERVAKASPSPASHHAHGRGRGHCNQTSHCCTSWRDTSKQCTRYISIICVYRCINYNTCMHAVTFLLILACVDLMHLEVVWTCDGKTL